MRASASVSGAGTPFDWPTAIGYSRQPFTSLSAGPGALAAGVDGILLGRFGWADPQTGQCSNARTDGALIGFVLPVVQFWNFQRVRPTRDAAGYPVLELRAGLPCVLASTGDFYARFPFPAQAGSQVWVDPATGLPYGADGGGFVATKWTVMESSCGCNGRLRISSFAVPFN